MVKPRLKKVYDERLCTELQQELGVSNIMDVPRLSKIVLNVGAKEAVSDSRILQEIGDALTSIAGQKCVRTNARVSIAGFKLREGMPIGVKVTLRRQRMYEFLDKLINLALPKTRDFQGVSTKLDGKGNYTIGIKESSIFPELERANAIKSFGLSITIATTSDEDQHAKALLSKLGMPFRKSR